MKKQISYIPVQEDTGAHVATLQQALLENDCDPKNIDGIFGSRTESAIKKYQTKIGVSSTGRVNNIVLNNLNIVHKPVTHSNGFNAISWEQKNGEQITWTDYIIDIIIPLFDTHFSNCKDIITFRSDYNQLNHNQQINIWAHLVCEICRYESSWRPTSWMIETTMGKDKVTGKQVRSEGLMQLSYQDQLNYSLPCRFNWQHDKDLNDNDPAKTIFNPYINLEFGVNILAKQIKDTHLIALSSPSKNLYWSVLSLNGKYSKVNEIIDVANAASV